MDNRVTPDVAIRAQTRSQTIGNLKDRVQQLEAQLKRLDNKNGVLHKKNYDLEGQSWSLFMEIDEFRAMNTQLSFAIEAHEFVHRQVFTCFPRLPPELRIRIWQLATPPRVITIAMSEDSIADSAVRIPVISCVCKESRDIFLREYVRIGRTLAGGIKRPTFAHLLNDTFCLASESIIFDDTTVMIQDGDDTETHLLRFAGYMQGLVGYTEPVKKSSIKRLALAPYALDFFIQFPQTLSSFDQFPDLEEVAFLTYDGRYSWQPTIRNPTDEEALESWEKGMRTLGLLRTMEGFAKWASLRTSVAAISQPEIERGIIDVRQGLQMMGPGNKHDYWTK